MSSSGRRFPDRLRINVFTSLPPDPAEVAGHSAVWLPPLAARADVAVWTTQPEWDLEDAPGLTVRAFDPASLPACEMNAADATFFALGAGASRSIAQVALLIPGVVLLHDLPTLPGGPAGPPADLAAAERAVALVTHSTADAEALRARTRLPVFHMPLSVRCDAAPLPAPMAPPHGLVAFGAGQHLSGTLRALAALPARGLFRLDAFGAVADRAQAEALIERHGLHGEAALHRGAPAEALSQALAAASLAIELRPSPTGEASASLLRAWAFGLPVIVGRAGWGAAFPLDAVLPVDGADDAEGIARHLMAFHANQERSLAAGRRGREIVRAAHAPEHAADALLAIAAAAPALHAGRAALDLAQAAAAALLEMVDAPTLRPTAPAVARAVSELFGLAG